MTRKNWYFYCLTLPYLLPILVMLAAKLAGRFLDTTSLLGGASFLAMIQIVSSGFQYFFFIFFIHKWARDKTTKQMARYSWAMPLWFWPWCTLWLMMLATFIGSLKIFVMIGLCSIPVGYVYVLLTHILTWCVMKARLVVD